MGKRAVDLFAGLGGFSIAAGLLGMKPVVACDNWEKAAATYKANFPDTTFVSGDLLHNGALVKVKEALGGEGCDVLFAGPPCQGWTQIRNGYHDLEDERNRLTVYAKKFVAALEPSAFVIENVPMLFVHGEGRIADRLVKRLRKPSPGLRYEVHAQVVDSASMGVPQQRRRALIIGVRKGHGEIEVPELPDLSWYFTAKRRGLPAPAGADALDEILDDPNDDRLTSVAKALGDLPHLPGGSANRIRPYASTAATSYQVWVRGAKRKVSGTGTPKLKPVTAHRLQRLGPGDSVKDLPASMRRALARKYASSYRKLHPDVPATTLFTKYDCAFHPTALRALNVREYARLQSIPDRYEFPVAARHAYAMIGNAVPPLMVARVLRLGLDLS